MVPNRCEKLSDEWWVMNYELWVMNDGNWMTEIEWWNFWIQIAPKPHPSFFFFFLIKLLFYWSKKKRKKKGENYLIVTWSGLL